MVDRLEVKLELEVYEQNGFLPYSDSEFYVKQTVHLNGVLFKGHLDLYSLFEDKTSSWLNGEYSDSYLDTCSCGVAGCAGIWDGVRINKKKNAYNYRAKKSDGYTKGILGSGKWSIWLSKENVEEIRDYILTFLKENAKVLSENRSDLTGLLNKFNLEVNS